MKATRRRRVLVSPRLALLVLPAALAVAPTSACRDDGGPSEPVFTGRMGGSGPGTGGWVVLPDSGPGPGDAADAAGGDPQDDGGVPPPPFSRAGLLASVADCTMARQKEFLNAAAILRDSLAAHVAAPTAATLANAQAAWRGAMGIWQELELAQIGPAARAPNPGSQGLRDLIYSFPMSARCGVDNLIVSKGYEGAGLTNAFVTQRGLDAIEYLLFYAGEQNACPPSDPINGSGTWAALPAAERNTRRAAYAAAAAADVWQKAQTLVTAWEPTGGNFRQSLTMPGSTPLFPSEQAALNAVSDALFYLDREVKDQKVARPTGIGDCVPGPCPEALESPYATVSTNNVLQNLIGFRRVFLGCTSSSLGFDDWLRAIGQEALAMQIETALQNAIATTSSLSPPLEQAVVAAPQQARALHAALKQITDLLKGQFITVLNLDLPMTVEGDND